MCFKNRLVFYFTLFSCFQFFISSVSVVKNYILLADVCNSVTLLAWRSEDCCLRELAKDFDNHIALSTAFVVDKPRLGVVVGDAEGNLQLLQFNPK